MSARRPVRSAGAAVAALAVGVVFSASAQAAPGDLDPTFSGDGKKRTDFASASSEAEAMVLQPDGKVVAVGNSGADFALARYNRDGTPDPSFSGNGRQTTGFAGGSGEATGVALQADGKIVAVGSPNAPGRGDFALARYNPDGSLDTTFSGDGQQTTDMGTIGQGATGVAIQADGKIVVVGEAGFGPGSSSTDFALARYDADGTLDPSFSGDGMRWTDFGGWDGATGVALQADGKIVAVGRVIGTTERENDFALARYNPDGSLDTTFSGGKPTTDFGGGDEATAVAIQGNGKIVVVGNADPGDFALARYDPNGTLDPSFSGDGKRRTGFAGGGGEATGVALQADGKIVAVGRVIGTTTAGEHDFALARYNPDGSLDTTFSGGKPMTDFGGGDEATAVAIQGNGRIVAVGDTETQAGESDFALARYHPDGTLDPIYSEDGKQTTSFSGSDVANGVALQADGKIVVVGSTEPGDFALTRYNPNGTLDTTFSGDGKQTTDFSVEIESGDRDEATAVAIQADGKIVAVGSTAGPRFSEAFALARYNPDGTLDPSFSGDGKQTTSFSGSDEATAVAIQADGKIVAGGAAIDALAATAEFALARYNPDGSLDTTFSGDGKQTTDFAGWDGAGGVALQGDGTIVAVGLSGPGTGPGFDFAIARYDPNGSLDPSFSGDGKQTTDFGGTDAARSVALQGDGKMVAVGQAGPGDFALARYNPNGSLDLSFSGDGKQTTDFGFGADDRASDVAIQGNGKFVAVGLASGWVTGGDFALARYNPDGSLDTTFSGDGKRRTDFGGSDDFATGVALQGDGRIVAVGRGLGTDRTSDFALARYLRG